MAHVCIITQRVAAANGIVTFFFPSQGGRTPTGWPQTQQLIEPDCRELEAEFHTDERRLTPLVLVSLFCLAGADACKGAGTACRPGFHSPLCLLRAIGWADSLLVTAQTHAAVSCMHHVCSLFQTTNVSRLQACPRRCTAVLLHAVPCFRL